MPACNKNIRHQRLIDEELAMCHANSMRRYTSLAAGLAGPVMMALAWAAPAISYADTPAPPPPSPPQYVKTYTTTATGPLGSSDQTVLANRASTSTAQQNSGASPAAPSGGGGGGGGGGVTPINPSRVSSLVSANTVVIHNAPPPAKIPSTPPPVSSNPAPQHAPVSQPEPPQAPPVVIQPPEPVAAPEPAPAQTPLITDTKPLGVINDVRLTSSTESGTSAEIIVLVLLTIGIWYYSHRVITLVTSPKVERA
jgi:hypothetical protein